MEDEIDLGFEGAEVSEIFLGILFFFGWEKILTFHIIGSMGMVYLSNIWLTFLMVNVGIWIFYRYVFFFVVFGSFCWVKVRQIFVTHLDDPDTHILLIFMVNV